jgi:hypothetical protein
LDLVLTNMPDRLANVRDEGRLGKSDHVIIMCDVLTNKISQKVIMVKNWSKADWTSIKTGIRDTTMADNCTAEAAWQHLRGRLDELDSQFVPVREFRERRSCKDM